MRQSDASDGPQGTTMEGDRAMGLLGWHAGPMLPYLDFLDAAQNSKVCYLILPFLESLSSLKVQKKKMFFCLSKLNTKNWDFVEDLVIH
jgi:hypothetical protein